MSTLYVGSADVVAGHEYVNITGTGNAMQTTEKIRISIDRSPFAEFPAYTKIFVTPLLTYTFEIDSVLLISNEVVPDFGVITNAYSTNTVPLSNNTESADIVQLTNGQQEVTKGSFTAFCVVGSTSNQDKRVIIRLYGNTMGLISTSADIGVPSDSLGVNAIFSYEVMGVNIPANELLSFTVEGDDNNLTILGGNTPSQIRLERLNI